MKRRTFLFGAGSLGIFAVLGGLAKAGASTQLRPPGGQNSTAFAASCLKCGKCVEACHTNVIGVATLEEGLLQARMPRMNFHLGYCDLCMKCVDACPTDALERQSPQSVHIGVAQIQRQSCIAWQWAACDKCVKVCKWKAISLDAAGRPVVDEKRCNGCGQCEYVCPATELRSYKLGQPRGIVVVAMKQPTGNLY